MGDDPILVAATTAGERLVANNRTVLSHILAMQDETLRQGVRASLLPALAAADWQGVGDAVEALWRGEPPAAAPERDAQSANVIAALAALAREPPTQPASAHDLAFALVRNPLARPAAAATEGAEGHAAVGIDYDFSRSFWTGQPPTVSGMLGGLDQTHAPDVAGSLLFLARLGFAADVCAADGGGRALDVGAGIGRVAQHVLLQRFGTVDLLEQDQRFLKQARAELPVGRVGACICAGLQAALLPPVARYLLVWVQWVLNYLTDDDLIEFLARAAASLNTADARSCVLVKETHVREGAAAWLDTEDASLCRTRGHFEELFKRAGLRVRQSLQEVGMPRGMLPVRMWALEPAHRAQPAVAPVGELEAASTGPTS
ncbi:AdoMet dependent proline di-methyltransferase-domain-containing protein [Pavlovales sp. CCMP2436]|nr:AdoMet dependent proline di-methyltransferase-domain-containing protein [Pavlovales sp. CCMP2436]|mmetsp:Transcript_14852/g.37566  ORF Transcript_14852/g.37566 Transcript_14852/m.37566 type:complete len:374 (-) Transcript_14852:150-1271(-)